MKLQISAAPQEFLTAEEEKALSNEWLRDYNFFSMRQLVERNLGFVVQMARQYAGKGVDLDDLINEGNLGLIEAAKRFDPSKDVRFLTYAAWWVKRYILQALKEADHKLKLPDNVLQNIVFLRKEMHKLSDKLNRMPTVEELAKATGFSVKEVRHYQQIDSESSMVSTNINLGEDSDQTLGDLLEQKSVPSADSVFFEKEMKDEIKDSLNTLNEKEKQIIIMYFGLQGEPKTLDQIAESLKPEISRERVRQIRDSALAKIKQVAPFLKNYLKVSSTKKKFATVDYLSPEDKAVYSGNFNALLQLMILFSMQVRQAHWNTKGMSFAGLHPLYDEVYDHCSDAQDLLAERCVQLGTPAQGTYDHLVAKLTGVQYHPMNLALGFAELDHLKIVVDLGKQLSKAFHDCLEAMAKLENVSADILIGIARQLDKDIWKLEAHLEAPGH